MNSGEFKKLGTTDDTDFHGWGGGESGNVVCACAKGPRMRPDYQKSYRSKSVKFAQDSEWVVLGYLRLRLRLW
jgi:hypothetical protein